MVFIRRISQRELKEQQLSIYDGIPEEFQNLTKRIERKRFRL